MPPIGITNIIINLLMANVRDLAASLKFSKNRTAQCGDVGSIILIIIYYR